MNGMTRLSTDHCWKKKTSVE